MALTTKIVAIPEKMRNQAVVVLLMTTTGRAHNKVGISNMVDKPTSKKNKKFIFSNVGLSSILMTESY